MCATFKNQRKEKNNITRVHTYLSTRSRGGWLLWSFLPNGRNSMRTDCPLGSFNVIDPLVAVFRKMFRTDDKNTSRCEIYPVRTNKSKPLILYLSTHRATMQRNASTKHMVWSIATVLHCTATWRHFLVWYDRVQCLKPINYLQRAMFTLCFHMKNSHVNCSRWASDVTTSNLQPSLLARFDHSLWNL